MRISIICGINKSSSFSIRGIVLDLSQFFLSQELHWPDMIIIWLTVVVYSRSRHGFFLRKSKKNCSECLPTCRVGHSIFIRCAIFPFHSKLAVSVVYNSFNSTFYFFSLFFYAQIQFRCAPNYDYFHHKCHCYGYFYILTHCSVPR